MGIEELRANLATVQAEEGAWREKNVTGQRLPATLLAESAAIRERRKTIEEEIGKILVDLEDVGPVFSSASIDGKFINISIPRDLLDQVGACLQAGLTDQEWLAIAGSSHEVPGQDDLQRRNMARFVKFLQRLPTSEQILGNIEDAFKV